MVRALIIVDVQNDFLPGGAVEVPNSEKILPVINKIQNKFEVVVASKNWYPFDHGSFAANHNFKSPGDLISLYGVDQILQPVHCQQESSGANFPAGLEISRIQGIFYKGTDPTVASYSAFFDKMYKHSTKLDQFLRNRNVSEVYVCGIALEDAVKATCIDANTLGFKTLVIADACTKKNLLGSEKSAVFEMLYHNVEFVRSDDIKGEWWLD